MKPPNRVQVGPYAYSVEVDSVTLNAIAETTGNKLYGYMDPDSQTLHLSSATAEDMFADTLLHECLHAIVHAAGLQKRFEGDSEEEFVAPLATLLLDTLRRNPKLVDFLTNREAPKRRKAPKPSYNPLEQITPGLTPTEPWETT